MYIDIMPLYCGDEMTEYPSQYHFLTHDVHHYHNLQESPYLSIYAFGPFKMCSLICTRIIVH